MAFNNWGRYTLSPAQSMEISYWFGGPSGAQAGDDHGAQFCMAHPLGYGKLVVTSQAKENVVPNGYPLYRYYVVVYNAGRTTVDFSIQGGGMT